MRIPAAVGLDIPVPPLDAPSTVESVKFPKVALVE